MGRLETLPREVLDAIFVWLNPADLAYMPFVCRAIYKAVVRNTAIYRAVYLRHFDAPRGPEIDWIGELQDVARLEEICRRPKACDKEDEMPFIFEMVTRLLRNANTSTDGMDDESMANEYSHFSRNRQFLDQLFSVQSNSEAFLQQSSLFERARLGPLQPSMADVIPSGTQQRTAKLHCLYGKPIMRIGESKWHISYPWALAKVYDLRRYTPQRPDRGIYTDARAGHVNWEMIEALMIAIFYAARRQRLTNFVFVEVLGSRFSGSWQDSHIPHPRGFVPPQGGTEASFYQFVDRDPYGVTGTWHRLVCYLDHESFRRIHVQCAPQYYEEPLKPFKVDAICRLFSMKLKISGIEPHGPQDGKGLPIVHFSGQADPLDAHGGVEGTRITGNVRMTTEGEVRWEILTTILTPEGEPARRWSSHGIQIGGRKSARGVIGSWLGDLGGNHHATGPQFFWKVNEVAHERMDDENILPPTIGGVLPPDTDVDSDFEYEGEPEHEPEMESEPELIDHPGAIPIPIPTTRTMSRARASDYDDTLGLYTNFGNSRETDGFRRIRRKR